MGQGATPFFEVRASISRPPAAARCIIEANGAGYHGQHQGRPRQWRSAARRPPHRSGALVMQVVLSLVSADDSFKRFAGYVTKVRQSAARRDAADPPAGTAATVTALNCAGGRSFAHADRAGDGPLLGAAAPSVVGADADALGSVPDTARAGPRHAQVPEPIKLFIVYSVLKTYGCGAGMLSHRPSARAHDHPLAVGCSAARTRRWATESSAASAAARSGASGE
jgi:hypothetical protein